VAVALAPTPITGLLRGTSLGILVQAAAATELSASLANAHLRRIASIIESPPEAMNSRGEAVGAQLEGDVEDHLRRTPPPLLHGAGQHGGTCAMTTASSTSPTDGSSSSGPWTGISDAAFICAGCLVASGQMTAAPSARAPSPGP